MNKSPSFTIAAILAMTIAMTPALFPQGLVVEPDSIDFGSIPVGLTGISENYRLLRVTNRTNQTHSVQISVTNINNPETIRLYEYRAEIHEAHSVLRQIYDAIGSYRQDYYEDPPQLYTLAQLGYLEIDEDLLWYWHFSLIGRDPVVEIEATADYGNIVVRLNVLTGLISGESYGEHQPVSSFELPAGDRRDFIVGYCPENQEDIFGQIWIGPVGQQISTRLFGSSYFNNALELSTNAIDFGDVYAGRRVSREFRITNTAGIFTRVGCEVRNSDQYYVFDNYVAAVHDFLLAINSAIAGYTIEHGDNPSSIDELQELGYLTIPDELEREWTFALIGQDPITQIEAISTAELQRGAGHTVMLDTQTDRFSGLGFYNNVDPDLLYLGTGRSTSFRVCFTPNNFRDFEGIIHFRSYFQDNYNIFQDFEILLFGTGRSVSDPGELSHPTTLLLNPAFPNPFNSTAIVTFTTPFTGLMQASLMDVNGREWTKWTTQQASPGVGRLTIDGAGLPAGAYLLRLNQGELNAVRKVVLVK